MKNRILLLIKGLSPGGAEQLLLHAAPYHDTDRFEYLVAYVITTKYSLAGDLKAAGDTLLGAHLAGAAIEASMLGAAHSCANPLTARFAKTTIEFAAKQRMPAIYGFRQWPDAGGLVSYGSNLADLAYRGAGHVDKILRGANPAYLPVEQATKFELAIDLKTAKALGLTIPPSLLARADQGVE